MFSRKGVLPFGAAVIAACACAMPWVASAASWSPIGTEHTLDSSNFGFHSNINDIEGQCGETFWTADVSSAANLTITNATFRNCNMLGSTLGECTSTWTSTNLPWTATAITTSTVQIHGVDIDWRLEDIPGNPGSCTPFAGVRNYRLTGTVTGLWTGNSTREIVFMHNITGLTTHGMSGSHPYWNLRGTLRATGDLTVNP
jgi:hypothetical protein